MEKYNWHGQRKLQKKRNPATCLHSGHREERSDDAIQWSMHRWIATLRSAASKFILSACLGRQSKGSQ
jgi:hypothetical protein